MKQDTIERYLATVMASSNVPRRFEVGVVSIIVDSNVHSIYTKCKPIAQTIFCTLIIENYRGLPPTRVSWNSGLWTRD